MVAIFPGHVGKDTGAIDPRDSGDDEYLSVESTLNGMIAARVATAFKTLGIEYAIYVGSLEDRIEMAHRRLPQLGISLHCDALAQKHGVRGAHVINYPRSTYGIEYAREIIKAWKTFVEDIPLLRDHSTARDDLYILRKSRFPVILLEMGFLTNVEDEAYLYNDHTQTMITRVIVQATLNTLMRIKNG